MSDEAVHPADVQHEKGKTRLRPPGEQDEGLGLEIRQPQVALAECVGHCQYQGFLDQDFELQFVVLDTRFGDRYVDSRRIRALSARHCSSKRARYWDGGAKPLMMFGSSP
ncbi:hypothetical protein [Rhizobium sp. BK418]|uniref:hypothetical protein n=1 Tax=Rhizobium sp. BK418 TaxID=2512120 RepID=UPI001FE009F8|nr:hypothetical protein [Rhizobium sp. BK418]